jgi:hypothetical protein
MSTTLHDFATHAALGVSVAPGHYSADTTGAAVDLRAADGPAFAVLTTGEVTGDTAFTATIEESHDQTTWVDIDVDFPDVVDGNTTVVRSFPRTRRYVRAVVAVSGGDADGNVGVLIGGQKKTV